MTRDDLVRIMAREGLPAGMLCAPPRSPSDCFVLRERQSGWEIFYAERGLETALSTFPTEDAACRALLDQLRQYAAAAGDTRQG